MTPVFRHRERDRTIVFGPAAIDEAGSLLPERYALLTTSRAAANQPSLADGAALIVDVPSGAVDELASDLRHNVEGLPLVALGGGRVIDTSKAIAAAEGITDVVAIPTSLAGAEMTGVHRHARGVSDDVPRVRPTLVINDPTLSASLPADQLAAGTANALGHAITAVVSSRSSAIAEAVGADAIRRLAHAWAAPALDRQAIALGALLAAWSVDLSGLGPHHALAQTAVRMASLEHARVNAALLPHTAAAFRRRAPERLARIDQAMGSRIEDLAERLRTRAGAEGLGALATDSDLLSRTVSASSGRAELERVPPAIGSEEVEAIYLAAASTSRP
ncbi:MAG TPA: iron-containing alcohol dehydrogenase [Solirubrobacteraceae bacterium]|nr:iron-containing alcohol dehydrogenase [Solirubrobacteraceae bacterium]